MAEKIIGNIFSKDEADKNYGPVLLSVSISSSELKALIGQSNKLVMFNANGGKLSVLKEGRAVLYPGGFSPKSDEKYGVYSKSKVVELLDSGKEDTTFVEQRKDVISVTNGQYTLEAMDWCPPFCS